jgi:hypothetical protein
MTTGVWPEAIVAGRRVDGQEVAGVLELGEEVDAGLDVVGRAAGAERRHDDAVEGGAGLRRVAVERDLALVLGPSRSSTLVGAGPRRRRSRWT